MASAGRSYGRGQSRYYEVILVGEARAIVERAWARRRPDCELLFHLDGKPLSPMLSELRRTCAQLGIPYAAHGRDQPGERGRAGA